MRAGYRKGRYLLALVLFITALTVSVVRGVISSRRSDAYTVGVVKPGCTENGYSIYTFSDGHTEIRDVVPAAGHSFGEWVIEREASGAECGVQAHLCRECGFSESEIIFPEDNIAKLALYGSLDGISKTQDVKLTGTLLCEDRKIDAFISLKKQGHESLAYEKNNYTIKFFRDEEYSEKNRLVFGDWREEHKYVLKANYCDTSQCRNIVVSNIWAEMAADRDHLAKELETLSNYGAIDGFPVAVYMNDSFFGLYTMNLHKDDDLFNIEDGKKQAVAVLNYHTSEEAEFRAMSSFLDESDWEIEACGTEDETWARISLNELIAFVMGSSDEEFRNGLMNYLDVDAAIDYLIALYSLSLCYNGTRDLVLVTYDGKVWIPSIYDAGKSFGLSEIKGECFGPEEFLPVLQEGQCSSETGSLLWDRLLLLYRDRIIARYAELRKDILSEKHLTEAVTGFLGGIPEDYYEADSSLYPEENQLAGGHEAQIKYFISQRFLILDRIFTE